MERALHPAPKSLKAMGAFATHGLGCRCGPGRPWTEPRRLSGPGRAVCRYGLVENSACEPVTTLGRSLDLRIPPGRARRSSSDRASAKREAAASGFRARVACPILRAVSTSTRCPRYVPGGSCRGFLQRAVPDPRRELGPNAAWDYPSMKDSEHLRTRDFFMSQTTHCCGEGGGSRAVCARRASRCAATRLRRLQFDEPRFA